MVQVTTDGPPRSALDAGDDGTTPRLDGMGAPKNAGWYWTRHPSDGWDDWIVRLERDERGELRAQIGRHDLELDRFRGYRLRAFRRGGRSSRSA